MSMMDGGMLGGLASQMAVSRSEYERFVRQQQSQLANATGGWPGISDTSNSAYGPGQIYERVILGGSDTGKSERGPAWMPITQNEKLLLLTEQN